MAQAMTMDRLDRALNRESYEWLASQHPDLLEAVESELQLGRTPEQLRLFVIRKTGREELALRVEQAAHHYRAEQVR
jgi:hypothetical protein